MWDKIPFYSLLLANLMKKNLSLHYCPDDGWFADPIPFYWEGSYHVFFMKAPFAGGGSSWEHIASHDLVHWDEFPTAIRPGSIGSPDELACMTGSIIEKDGTFHMFYTGVSNAGQSICHATSRDLIHWDKDPTTQSYCLIRIFMRQSTGVIRKSLFHQKATVTGCLLPPKKRKMMKSTTTMPAQL